ncbi:MAG TPA: hypothetical protein VJ837_01495, partial [Candidatus Paceibacterota bacterium]|nr:hypothetical protein [Candidatus Paceibacterota bacterium]
ESEYSEGHEMHSTPMRFVAELGIVGVILYLWFTFEVLATGYRSWRGNMRTPYEAVSLLLLVALVSLTVSYGYNRQMTDRTFWLLLPFTMALETWSQVRHQGLHRKHGLRRTVNVRRVPRIATPVRGHRE